MNRLTFPLFSAFYHTEILRRLFKALALALTAAVFAGCSAAAGAAVPSREQHGQFPVPFPYGVQLLLERIHLLVQLLAVLLIDVGRKLLLLHPGEVCHPLEIVQHNFAQLIFPDMVGRTRGFALFSAGAARKIVPVSAFVASA